VDACDNSAWYNYTIRVVDTTAPEVQWTPSAPQNGTFTCDYPEAPIPTVSDNCGGGDYTLVESPESGSCDLVSSLTRTWTFFDACGNTFTVTQVLTLEHTQPPVVTPEPEDLSLECDQDIPTQEVSAQDECQNPLSAPLSESRTDGSCLYSYTINRVWTATDDCGLTNSVDQVITVSDTTPPDFPNRPADRTLEFECSDYPFDNVSATDNCGDAHLTTSRTEVGRRCLYDFERC